MTRTVFDPANNDWAGDDILDAIFDDEAPGPIAEAGAGPVTGRVRPAARGRARGVRRPAGGGRVDAAHHRHLPFDSGTLRRWGLDSPQVGCTRVEIPQAQTAAADAVGATSRDAQRQRDAERARHQPALRVRHDHLLRRHDARVCSRARAMRRSRPPSRSTGLQPGTTYHFRIEAIRENGVVAVAGQDATFTTGSRPAATAARRPPRLRLRLRRP